MRYPIKNAKLVLSYSDRLRDHLISLANEEVFFKHDKLGRSVSVATIGYRLARETSSWSGSGASMLTRRSQSPYRLWTRGTILRTGRCKISVIFSVPRDPWRHLWQVVQLWTEGPFSMYRHVYLGPCVRVRSLACAGLGKLDGEHFKSSHY